MNKIYTILNAIYINTTIKMLYISSWKYNEICEKTEKIKNEYIDYILLF